MPSALGVLAAGIDPVAEELQQIGDVAGIFSWHGAGEPVRTALRIPQGETQRDLPLEQNGVLMEEKKGYSDVCDQLMSERRNVMDYIMGLRDQRDEFSQEFRARIAGPALQSLKGTSEVVRLPQAALWLPW